MRREGLLVAAMAIALFVAGCSSDGSGNNVQQLGPEPPSWVHVTHTAPDSINLAWEPVTSSEMGLDVERSVHAPNAFARLDTVSANVGAYTDTSVTDSTLYYYRLRSYDVFERRGDPSPHVWAYAVVNESPEVPSDPSPPPDSLGVEETVTLSWTSTDPDGTVLFDLHFGEARNALKLRFENESVTSYVPDTCLALTHFYFWRVIARDNHGATSLSPIWAFGTRIQRVSVPEGYLFRGDCGLFYPDDPISYCPPENPWLVNAYSIDKYEVSNQLFAQFLQAMLEGKYARVVDGQVYSIVGDTLFAEVYPDGDRHSGICYEPGGEDELGVFASRAGMENNPVVEVTWNGARRFAQFYGRRLPSEIEWEKAARGTLSTFGDTLFAINDSTDIRLGFGYPYPWGGDEDFRRFNCEGSGDPFEEIVGVATTPVGFYDGSTHSGYSTRSNASVYGVFDLAGNVSEWCADDAEPYHGGPYGNMKIVKGGGWTSPPIACQTFWRAEAHPDSCDRAIGFRTVAFE